MILSSLVNITGLEGRGRQWMRKEGENCHGEIKHVFFWSYLTQHYVHVLMDHFNSVT